MEKQQAGWGGHPAAGSPCQTGWLSASSQPATREAAKTSGPQGEERPREAATHPCHGPGRQGLWWPWLLSGLCVLQLAGGSSARVEGHQQRVGSLPAGMFILWGPR